MKKEYLIKATIALAVLILASSIPAMVSSLPEAQSQSLANSNQNTSMSEYQPVCPEESYNKITELYEEGLSEDEIAEELAFPLDIVNRYLEGNFTPPSCPEPDQRMPLSECPTYSKIKDLYGEGWSKEEIAKTLELPIDVVNGFLSGNYTIISSCPEPYQKSEKNASSSDLHGKHETSNEQSETGVNFTMVTPSEDELLGKYEKSDRQFKRTELGNRIVYGHHRRIDDVIVEGDRINYQFDKSTKELKKRIIHWRDDLPEHLPPVISKEEAESIAIAIAKSKAKGKIMDTSLAHTRLRYISPDSCWHPIKPTPENPCWIVYFADDKGYNIDVIIIDAVEGKVLGHGVPFPSSGFSFSGPQDTTNCTGAWEEWHQNAESWFNTMGYPTEAMLYPNEAKVKSHIQSYETAMFYEVAHGNYDYFTNDCSGDPTTADEIHNWIADYPKMPFTFIHSCGGMCENGPGTLSYEFRKGSTEDTVTVGTCLGDPNCIEWKLEWQDAFFNYMNQGWTVKDAFD